MRLPILLTTAAVLIAACAAPAPTGGSAVRSVDAVDLQAPHASAAPDITRWTAYRQFNFASTSLDISTSDLPKLNEIIARLDGDSSLDIGIDGTLERDGVSQTERDLSARRAASVRRALMETGAGIASYKIQMGPFGDPEHRRPGHIQVVIGPRAGSPRSPL